ncbi:hypothetical protein AAFF_G00397890 [Aldrovandia affinis]|uniref:LBH domain-containing protein n=1 Tax=Aldrovandia affinis TaxID=143900 RepID=A0AAD7WKI8_9TELE|nr:hypothetical protein AAFF_G00397890 [Aldrovandia affinis]
MAPVHPIGKFVADFREDTLTRPTPPPPDPFSIVITLETSCPPVGPTEGDCCDGCHPLPAPPLPPAPILAVAQEHTCPAIDRVMEVMMPQEVPAENRKGERLPFQIFPDPVEALLGPDGSLGSLQQKERLPSIVVEPTDVSEVESGELRWPPEDMDFQDEEDLFLEQCIPPANIADWSEEDEEEEEKDEGTIITNTHASLIDEEFRDDTPTLLHDSAPALN